MVGRSEDHLSLLSLFCSLMFFVLVIVIGDSLMFTSGWKLLGEIGVDGMTDWV